MDEGRRVVLTGASSEIALCRWISSRAPVETRAGREDQTSLAHTVGTAGLLLSGDTGVAHLATAFATPSVTLFGPVAPSLWGARIDPDLHVALWAGRSGDTRPGDALGATLDERLGAIGVAEVLQATLDQLKRTART